MTESTFLYLIFASCFAVAACDPSANPEIGHRVQAQVHQPWSSDGNIAYAPHAGGAAPGQVWVMP